MTIDELKAELHTLHKRLAELDANIAALVVAPPEPEPEEQPEKWPGLEGEPVVEWGAVYGDWYVHQGMGIAYHRIYGYTRAEAVANWNAAVMGQRLINAGVRLTPEGWVEIKSDSEYFIRVYDDCVMLTRGAQAADFRSRGPYESDAALVARLNAPAGTPIIRIRSKA